MKRNFTFISILLGMLLAGCASETEQKGLNEVAQTWGQVTKMAKGVSASTEEVSGKYFDIEVTNADFFSDNTAPEDREAISGGIAWALYKNFSDEEKKKYAKYAITLKTGSAQEEHNYTADRVAMYYTQEKKAKNYMQKLLKEDFEYIKKHYVPQKQISVDSMKVVFGTLLEKVSETPHVEILNIRSAEATLPDSSKVDVVYFMGVVQKEKTQIPFMIGLEAGADKNSIVTIQYQSE